LTSSVGNCPETDTVTETSIGIGNDLADGAGSPSYNTSNEAGDGIEGCYLGRVGATTIAVDE